MRLPHTHKSLSKRASLSRLLLPGLALFAFVAVAFVVVFSLTPGRTSAAQADAGSPVSILFTAFDKEQNSVTTLRQEDVRVKEDGSARAVRGLKRQSDLPLLLTVALDTSMSQERVIGGAKLAADVFVKGIMLPGADKAAVVTFSNETTLEQAMTGDVEAARAAIARVKIEPPSGYIGGGVIVSGRDIPRNLAGSTALWDAVWVISDDVMGRSYGPGRRTLVLLTDGQDTSSRAKLDDAVKGALQSEMVVYAIGIGDPDYSGVDKDALRKLTERTGGRAFFPKKVGELTGIFTRIRDELLSQYVVTFSTPNTRRDGSYHKLEIEITDPALRKQGVRVAYPHGYFAGNTFKSVKN